MDKIDFKKALHPLYQPSAKEVTVVEVPTMHFLMLDGQGDPNTSAAFSAGMETLFALSKVRFAPFSEGLCAQVMHIGPFSTEGPTIERVHAFIAASGRTRVGKHHEIYLSDIRRADPAKWKTIIRQPMGE